MEDSECSLASERWTLHSSYAAEQRTGELVLSQYITTVAYCFGKKKCNSSIIYLTTVMSSGLLAHLQQFYVTPDFTEYHYRNQQPI